MCLGITWKPMKLPCNTWLTHHSAGRPLTAAPRRRGPSAPAYLTVSHYTELLESKDLVLVRGDIVVDKAISMPEVRHVRRCVAVGHVHSHAWPMLYYSVCDAQGHGSPVQKMSNLLGSRTRSVHACARFVVMRACVC